MGYVKIGEQLGDTIQKDIKISGTDIASFELIDGGLNIVGTTPMTDTDGNYIGLPCGLTLTADGLLAGTPRSPTGIYKFDVVARNSQGLEKQKTFRIQVIDGYSLNTVAVYLKPSAKFERLWNSSISSSAFTDVNLYRGSDGNYGIQSSPLILLKRNVLSNFSSNISLALPELRRYIKEKINTRTISLRTGKIGRASCRERV